MSFRGGGLWTMLSSTRESTIPSSEIYVGKSNNHDIVSGEKLSLLFSLTEIFNKNQRPLATVSLANQKKAFIWIIRCLVVRIFWYCQFCLIKRSLEKSRYWKQFLWSKHLYRVMYSRWEGSILKSLVNILEVCDKRSRTKEQCHKPPTLKWYSKHIFHICFEL